MIYKLLRGILLQLAALSCLGQTASPLLQHKLSNTVSDVHIRITILKTEQADINTLDQQLYAQNASARERAQKALAIFMEWNTRIRKKAAG